MGTLYMASTWAIYAVLSKRQMRLLTDADLHRLLLLQERDATNRQHSGRLFVIYVIT